MKNALGLSIQTGRTIVSDAGEWDLSRFGTYILEGVARWRQPEGLLPVRFGYKQLGSVFTVGNDGGIFLEGLDISGYDRLIVASTADDKCYLDSEMFFQDGAQPMLTNGWVELIAFKGCKFEATPIAMRTGGGVWSGAWNPNNSNPGIRNLLIEDSEITRHGGFDVETIRWDNIRIKGIKISSDTTKASLDEFYSQFGIDPDTHWPNGAGMGSTGAVLAAGFRVALRIGRANSENRLPFFDSQGPCTIEDVLADGFYCDIPPKPNKYKQKADAHITDLRGGTFNMKNVIGKNLIDYAYAVDPAYAAASAPGNVEGTYCKGKITYDNITMINCGPGEGPSQAPKPAYSGSSVTNLTVVRDKKQLPEPWKTRLNDFPDIKHWNGKTACAPGEVPNLDMAGLKLHEGSVMDIVTTFGFEEPPQGWADLFHSWYDSTPITNMTVEDLDGNVLWSN